MIVLPIAYEEALKGAKAITIEQTIEENGFRKKIPLIIPPLNTNIAFDRSQILKPYIIPMTNVFDNQYNLPFQKKYI